MQKKPQFKIRGGGGEENRLFGICIPTFNRAKLLEKCILSFLDDAIKYNVPIYISDNNSNDCTDKVVKNLQKIYKNIFYFKQKRNLGIDKNMLNVLEAAQTKYVLWLGSDDTLNKGAIEEILKKLQTNPDLCILCADKEFQLKEHYNSVYDFFHDYGMLGYGFNMHFSTLIVNVEKIKKQKNKEKYYQTLHLYAGVTLDYLQEKQQEKGFVDIQAIKSGFLNLASEFNQKSWFSSMFKVYFFCIPKWYRALDENYKRNELVQESYKEFLYKREEILDAKFSLTRLNRINRFFSFIYKVTCKKKY